MSDVYYFPFYRNAKVNVVSFDTLDRLEEDDEKKK